MMKPLFSLALVALLPVAALAAAPADVVLKDTRQYDVYVASISGAPDCKMPAADGAGTPIAGECSVKKQRYVFDGELLTRNIDTGLCTRSTWRQVDRTRFSYDRFEMSSPSLEMSESTYKCDEDGRALTTVQ
jgi:hypothetical protein